MVQSHLGALLLKYNHMSTLSHFDSVLAKPGMSFSAKNTHGFAGKLHTAVHQNFHGLGTLRNNPIAIEALKTQVLKNQHLIRSGGLSKYQAEKMVAKIAHEATMKGEHLSSIEKDAIKKLGQHLTKQATQPTSTKKEHEYHGITAINKPQHTSSVSQIGDTTKVTSGQTPHAAGGIASLMKNKGLPTSTNLPSSKPIRPSNIKLSF